MRVAALFVLLRAVVGHADGDSVDDGVHTFEQGAELHIWFDKLGPYNNPQENYPYDTANLCELQGTGVAVQSGRTMSDALEGSNLVASSKMPLAFRIDVTDAPICEIQVTEQLKGSVEALIQENYWYSFYIDELPTWAFVGEHSALLAPQALFPEDADKEQAGHFGRIKEAAKQGKGIPVSNRLFTHRTFTITADVDHIVAVDVDPADPQELQLGDSVTLTYSVVWKEAQPEQTFDKRFDRYLESTFFEHKVHWFAILNSFILCLFLCAVVALILMKTLKRDFSKFSADEIDDIDDLKSADDSGWKLCHGDVFRQPQYLMMFSACYSNGCHIVAVFVLSLFVAMWQSMYSQRGGIRSALIVVYMVTMCCNGYQGGKLYRMYAGRNWKNAMIAQVSMGPTFGLMVFSVINSVAWAKGSVHAVPALRIIQALALYIFTAIPAHVGGTLLGRKVGRDYTFPARVHHLKRPIPQKHWAVLPGLCALGGFVPFGCMFIEMYYLFSAFWSYNKVYYVYGFLLAVFVVLSIVFINVSITCTYVLLNAEDYRWHWTSFLCTSSTGIYVFLYSCIYYVHSTSMSGMLQWTYYFGSTLLFATAVAFYAGALGYMGASWFVNLIYANIKVE